MTTSIQESAHRANVTAAEGARQAAHAAARLAYDGTPATYAAYAAAVKASDVAYCRALISSSVANGLGRSPTNAFRAERQLGLRAPKGLQDPCFIRGKAGTAGRNPGH